MLFLKVVCPSNERQIHLQQLKPKMKSKKNLWNSTYSWWKWGGRWLNKQFWFTDLLLLMRPAQRSLQAHWTTAISELSVYDACSVGDRVFCVVVYVDVVCVCVCVSFCGSVRSIRYNELCTMYYIIAYTHMYVVVLLNFWTLDLTLLKRSLTFAWLPSEPSLAFAFAFALAYINISPMSFCLYWHCHHQHSSFRCRSLRCYRYRCRYRYRCSNKRIPCLSTCHLSACQSSPPCTVRTANAQSHPFSLIMCASSMMNFPSLYFWLDSYACSYFQPSGVLQHSQ